MGRRPIIAGNWKLHLGIDASVELARAVARGVSDATAAEVVVAPVFTALRTVREALAGTPVRLAAQNLWHVDQGAFTGEVSAPLLLDAGCTQVIVGHSERRHVFGERDATIRLKVEAALRAGLTPIACVGETLEEREAGRTLDVVLAQVSSVVEQLKGIERLRLAYEPVWAIGTGKVASPDDAQAVHAAIRGRVAALASREIADAMPILYGGSVKPSNAGELLEESDIDGALVGGASLDAEQFLGILAAV